MRRTTPDAAQCAVRLRRAVLVLARRLRPLQGEGISSAKLSVIGQLYRAGQLTPTGLAEREGVKLPTLTRLLAELEEDGWLAREADASDGRRTLLSLTSSGRKRLVASARAEDAPLADVIATILDADERLALLRACELLERVGDAMGVPIGTASPSAAERTGTQHTKRRS